MARVYCTDWLTARNAANSFAGVGGKVYGCKEGFVAVRNQFNQIYIVGPQPSDKGHNNCDQDQTARTNRPTR